MIASEAPSIRCYSGIEVRRVFTYVNRKMFCCGNSLSAVMAAKI